jgi:outer membrane protein OmpA-like peptidoglycan-associated protein
MIYTKNIILCLKLSLNIKKERNMRVVGLLVVASLWLGAECSQDIKREFINIVSVKPLSLSKIEKLYNQCKSKDIAMMYFLAKADRAEKDEESESAYFLYKESLDMLDSLPLKVKKTFFNLKGLEDYLYKQKENYKPISPQEIKNKTRSFRNADMSIEYTIEDLPINFRTGSSKIEKRVNLIQAQNIGKALKLKKYANKIIYITGYTDTRGTERSNYDLGKKRAISIKRYLKDDLGLKNRVVPDSKGEAFPIYKKGKENLYKSRRVKITIGDR